MKRLREIEASTPLERKAQELVSAIEPLPEAAERMARVRQRLDEPRGLLAALRRLPALAALALIGLFGASAFAAVRVLVEVQASRVESARPAQPAPNTAKSPSRSEPAEAKPELLDEEPAAAADLETAIDERVEPAPHARKERPRTRAKSVAEAAAEDAAHDSELVHRAVKALRRDGNPALAARLLEQDRVRNPNGPLAEEALSLRIEAALQLGDPRARAIAEQYLARYPRGRYLAIARRALSDAGR
jgi:hypothetical protein